MRHVKDRPGHDQRYSVSSEKLKALGWALRYTFEEALEDTVSWYRDNESWWRPIKTGEYAAWYESQYGLSTKGKS